VHVQLRFGVLLPLTNIPRFAQKAEQLGFDYVTAGEHVAFYGPISNAFISLSVAAGATQRIKLLSSATLLPLYPAALVAKMTAMLDVVSNGRFNLGVGVGGEFPREFEACNVPIEQRGARANEALAVIIRLLSEESVSFEGRFNRLHEVTIQPGPIQKPHPPIWVAGRKEPAMRRAARYGDWWMPYMYTPEQLLRSTETIAHYTSEYGRAAGSVRTALFTWATIYPDAIQAKRVAAEIVGQTYQQDFTRLVDRYLIAGSPADCRRRLQAYIDAGLETVLFGLACPPEDTDRLLHCIAEEIMPEFQLPCSTLQVSRLER
jgi:probable F420-dependent oxidoreductase